MEQYHVGQTMAVGIANFLALSPEEQAVVKKQVSVVLEDRYEVLQYTWTDRFDRNLFGNLLQSSKKLIEALGLEKKVGFGDYRVDVTRKNYRQS